MTSASTKVPASRANGMGMPAGGPIPVPRIVGNRRIRGGGIALATMLLAFGAALSGLALISVTHSSSYLAVSHPVVVGSTIQANDLTTVQISGGSGVTLIPAAAVNQVVGRRAAVSLVPGTLLSPAQITDKTIVTTGQAQIGISVRQATLPAAHLSPAEQISLVALKSPTNNAATGNGQAPSGPTEYAATVVDISSPAADGTVIIHVAVQADLAATILMLNANGGLGIVLPSGG